jgi:hypothetical protein
MIFFFEDDSKSAKNLKVFLCLLACFDQKIILIEGKFSVLIELRRRM